MPQHDWTSKGVDGCLIQPLWRSKAGPAKGSYPRLDTFMHGCVKYMFIVCVVFIYICTGKGVQVPETTTVWNMSGRRASGIPYALIWPHMCHMGPPGPIWNEYEPIWAQLYTCPKEDVQRVQRAFPLWWKSKTSSMSLWFFYPVHEGIDNPYNMSAIC